MPESETKRFDFKMNAWVRDDFLSRRILELSAPSVPPREGYWVTPAAKPRRSIRYRATIALAVAAIAMVWAWIGPGGSAIVAMGVVFCLLAWTNLPPPTPRAKPDDFRLMEVADDPDVCLVNATIVFDGRKIGTDRGVAWFSDGAMLFSGRRTSFAIGGEDVLPRSYWSEYGRERASALPADAVPLRTVRPRTYVLLLPVNREEDVAVQQARRFVTRRRKFRDRPEPSSVPRQWPPFTS